MERFFQFYINASIHVALAVISLCIVTVQRLNISVEYDLVGFLFFATIVCYYFVKYGVEAKKYLIVAKPAHKPIQIFSFFSFLACSYFFFQLPTRLWVIIGILTLLSAFYAVPLLPRSKNLRSLSGFKIFLVAVVWVGFTVIVPAISNGLGFSIQVLLLGLQNFILVLILILPFEIRDLKYDKVELKTLPQRWGIPKTKRFGNMLVFFFLILGLLLANGQWSKMAFYGLISILLLTVLRRTKYHQSPYFSSFWVEGIPILWLLLREFCQSVL